MDPLGAGDAMWIVAWVVGRLDSLRTGDDLVVAVTFRRIIIRILDLLAIDTRSSRRTHALTVLAYVAIVLTAVHCQTAGSEPFSSAVI